MKDYDADDYLMMSGIQHFCFCRRQWALIHLEQQWVENVLTAKGRIEHERCHDEDLIEKRGDIITIRGLRIVSHGLRLSGTCDVVEFRRDSKNGIPIRYCEGMWSPMPVEYKHGKPKTSDADLIQLCAEVIALEEMFVCKIERAALYYHEIRRREYCVITDEMRKKTKEFADEMYQYYQRGYTPKAKTSKHCKACSLVDICLPSLGKNRKASEYINEVISENR